MKPNARKRSSPIEAMKHCGHFYAIETDHVTVPDRLQRSTRLPGNPQGHARLGFAEFRRELLTVAMEDRQLGGAPRIRKMRATAE